VCEPPTTSASEEDDSTTADNTIELTIKSLKPPLTFTLSASPTSTISSLKQQLADSNQSKGAPGAESQRWILKGKSMGDSKLLKEFNVQDGAVINLMINKSTPAPPPPPSTSTSDDPAESQAGSSSTTGVPSLTLSEPSSTPSSSNPPPAVSIEKDLEALPLSTSSTSTNSTTAHSSSAYRDHIQQPELWQEIREVLERRFEGVANKEAECQQAWEGMLGGCQEWIEPGKKALIRERVGYSAMGGY